MALVIENAETVLSSSGVITFTPISVNVGDMLVVCGAQPGSSTRTYTISDDLANTWSQGQSTGYGGSVSYAGTCDVTNGGTVTVSVNPNTGTMQHTAGLWRVSGNIEIDVARNHEFRDSNGTSNDAFDPAAAMSANSIVFCATGFNASPGTISGPSTGTLNIRHENASYYIYDNSHVGSLTDKQTHTMTNARNYLSVAVVLREGAGGGGGGGLLLPLLLNS